MSVTKPICIFLLLAGAAYVALSPDFERATDTLAVDAAITKTCLDRHGFNPITRYSCRSGLYRAGPTAIGLGCAFNKSGNDLCDNFMAALPREDRIELERSRSTMGL